MRRAGARIGELIGLCSALSAAVSASAVNAVAAPSQKAVAETAAAAPSDLAASLPPGVLDGPAWRRMLEQMMKSGAGASALAAAQRMLRIFPDVETQEDAFRAILSLGEAGYPAPISGAFLVAGLEPSSESVFGSDYYLFKSLANQGAGARKWADYYRRKVGAEPTDRHRFQQAIEAYGKGDLAAAKKILSELLKRPADARNPASTRRIARTLARIYYEEKDYAHSLDVYRGFLLRSSEVTPTDWLEAAWNLYFLGKYPESLGALYNLEAPSAQETILLEKFMLRGLVYHSLCDRKSLDALIKSYDASFGGVVRAVLQGDSLKDFAVLRKLGRAPGASEWLDLTHALDDLSRERAMLSFKGDLKPIAQYLYSTEISLLQQRAEALQVRALEQAASLVVLTREKLRFLGFEIVRQQANPDTVFAQAAPKSRERAVAPAGARGEFDVKWLQPGDYWGDERLRYVADAPGRCEQ